MRRGLQGFSGPEWATRSFDSKDLVLNLLRQKPELRPTAEEALASSWIVHEGDVPAPYSPMVIGALPGALCNVRRCVCGTAVCSIGILAALQSLPHPSLCSPSAPLCAFPMDQARSCARPITDSHIGAKLLRREGMFHTALTLCPMLVREKLENQQFSRHARCATPLQTFSAGLVHSVSRLHGQAIYR